MLDHGFHIEPACRKYNIPVRQSRYKELNTYISGAVQGVQFWMMKGEQVPKLVIEGIMKLKVNALGRLAGESYFMCRG